MTTPSSEGNLGQNPVSGGNPGPGEGSVSGDGSVSKTDAAYAEGLLAGVIGAATIAVWFLILDLLKGRPLFTPSVLGRVVFRGVAPLGVLQSEGVSFEMSFVFTWFHGLVFCAIGIVAAWLIRRAEERPEFGYGIVLLIVVLQSGFIVACLFIAEPVLTALTVPSVLIGNVLATLTMGGFLSRRHPRLNILP